MGSVALQLLPLALTVAFTTLPIVATLAVLVNSRSSTRGWMITAGYFVGLTAVMSAATFGILRVGSIGQAPPLLPVVEVLAGVALVVLGVIRLVRRRLGRSGSGRLSRLTSASRLVASFRRLTNPRTFAIGFSFALHPENLLLCAAASVRITGGDLSIGERAVLVVAFALVGISTVAIPTLLYGVSADHVRPALQRVSAWLSRNTGTVTSVIIIAIGVVLIILGVPHFPH